MCFGEITLDRGRAKVAAAGPSSQQIRRQAFILHASGSTSIYSGEYVQLLHRSRPAAAGSSRSYHQHDRFGVKEQAEQAEWR